MKQVDTLAIVGLGLMGASLALAARKHGVARRIVGCARRAEVRSEALRLRMVDAAVESPAEAVCQANVAVFCLPVLAIEAAVRSCAGRLPRGCVVTDVGSTKAELARVVDAELAGSGAVFIGSHPIAGSDQSGIGAARADLYEGAVVVVTPPDGQAAPGLEAMQSLWTGVGARVHVMTPERHDAMLARTSHLPHLVAAALVRTVLGREVGAAGLFCGTGFRDTTRVAGGPEEVWHDIVKTNRAAIGVELAALADELAALRALVDGGDFEGVRQYLSEARAQRRALCGGA